ncbi:MAG: hypothetical protein ACRC67_01435 [Inquilinus sp.]|uniref:hypothetical protein n=1 Tax=Inquilinus sp. TaxID=1932117 RepID=UPI003F3B435B
MNLLRLTANRFGDLSLRIAAAAVVYSPLSALAQTPGTFDPTAPLDIIKQAQEAGKKSMLNATSFKDTGTNVGTYFMIAGGAVGLGYGLWSGMKLYQATQHGDRNRESSSRAIGGIATAIGIMIFGVVMGAGANWLLGG